MAFPKLFILFFKIYLPKLLLLLGYIIFISIWQTNRSENIIIKFTISLLISLYCTALSPSKSLFWDSTLSVHRNCLNCFVFCCYFFLLGSWNESLFKYDPPFFCETILKLAWRLQNIKLPKRVNCAKSVAMKKKYLTELRSHLRYHLGGTNPFSCK